MVTLFMFSILLAHVIHVIEQLLQFTMSKRPKERGFYMNNSQKEQLVQFVELNYSALFGTRSDDEEKLWKVITLQLNAMGSIKNEEGWRRSYKSLRTATRTKYLAIRKNKTTTLRMSDVEMKIVKMCKMEEELGSESNTNLPDTAGSSPTLESSASASQQLWNYSPETETDPSRNGNIGTTTDPDVVEIASPIRLEGQYGHSQNVHRHSGLPVPTQSSRVNSVPNQQQIGIFSNRITTNRVGGPPEPQSKRSYINGAQREKLVELVGKNYDALFGKVSNRLNADTLKAKLWDLITRQLNFIGPPKNRLSWKQCFNKMKDATKKKLTKNRQHGHRKELGRENLVVVELSVLEDKIVSMCKLEMLDGSRKLHELGFNGKAEKNLVAKSSNENFHISHQDRGRVCMNSTITSSMVREKGQQPGYISTNSTITSSAQPTPIIPREIRLHNYMNKSWHTLLRQSEEVCNSCDSRVETVEAQPSFVYNSSYEDPASSCYALPELGTESVACAIPTLRQPVAESVTNGIIPSGYEMPIDTGMPVTLSTVQGRSFTAENSQVLTSLAVQQVHSQVGSHQTAPVQLEVQVDNDDLDTAEIRSLRSERPQRRGVEINLHRHVRPRRRSYIGDSENEGNHPRRRVRLSVPLGVMAEESLELQRQTNALLSELVFEFRSTFNRRD